MITQFWIVELGVIINSNRFDWDWSIKIKKYDTMNPDCMHIRYQYVSNKLQALTLLYRKEQFI